MKLATLPPWLRETPVQHARTLRQRENSRIKALDKDLELWDHEVANDANKFDAGGKLMRFADIPKEITQVGPIKTKGPVRLTSLADGSVIKVVALRSEEFARTRGSKAGTKGTRYLLKSKGGDEFMIGEQMYKQLTAGLEYAAKHGKTNEEKGELEITLTSVTSGKPGKEITRRALA